MVFISIAEVDFMVVKASSKLLKLLIFAWKLVKNKVIRWKFLI